MITDLLIFWILCMLEAPAWCFVAIGKSLRRGNKEVVE